MVKNFDQTSRIKDSFQSLQHTRPTRTRTQQFKTQQAASPLRVDMSALSKASPLKRKPAESSKSPSKPKTALEPGNQPPLVLPQRSRLPRGKTRFARSRLCLLSWESESSKRAKTRRNDVVCLSSLAAIKKLTVKVVGVLPTVSSQV